MSQRFPKYVTVETTIPAPPLIIMTKVDQNVELMSSEGNESAVAAVLYNATELREAHAELLRATDA